MLIILEGPDGAGKSTLAAAIVEHLEARDSESVIELLHRGAPAPSAHPLDEYVAPLLDYRPRTRRHVICDRWHLGEYVYPRVLGRETKMDDAVFSYVEAFLASRGALVVRVEPSDDTIAANLTARVESGGKLGITPPLAAIRHLYGETYRRSWTVSYRLTCAFDPHKVARTVTALAETESHRAAGVNDFVTYVGPPTATRLLVGDVRGTEVVSGDNRAAFMPYPSTSGHYLFRALALILYGVAPDFGLVNVNDADDIGAVIRHLGPDASVVALGNRAHETLRRLNVPHGVVPHPQWWRRFLHGFPGEYAVSILRALNGDDLRGEHPIGSWLKPTLDETNLEIV